MSIAISFFISLLLMPSMAKEYSCSDYYEDHPVRNGYGLQILLKSNGFYTGKIDGQIGIKSKNAIKSYQHTANINEDGILGQETCAKLLVIKPFLESNNSEAVATLYVNEELKSIQIKLKNLGLYTDAIDGIKGSNTTKAIKSFQSKSGLIPDGIPGTKTLKALEKGVDAYIVIDQNPNEISDSSSSSVVASDSSLDLGNYNPNVICINGYINFVDIWVYDPCFYPVFVYRLGKIAQVNSAAERDAYLAERWSLTPEKIYSALGFVNTQNYINGINSPVNGLIMPTNKIYPTVVLGIKNDNNWRARPQSGPQDADAVFEVLVEGGMTRFINVFYQSSTSYHGPIRSARPTDPTVLRPVDGVLVASGGTPGLIPEIKSIGVPVISDQRTGYFRISSHPSGVIRKAPHNLYGDTDLLKARSISSGYKPSSHPQPLFAWGDPSTLTWQDITKMTLTFSNYTRTTWTWNGYEYRRTFYDAYLGTSSSNVHNTISISGIIKQISTTTLIALFCEPYIHPLELPSVKTIGDGRAIIMHNGKLLDVFWKRGANTDPFHIVDSLGNELYVPRGKVWISLVPNTKIPSFG